MLAVYELLWLTMISSRIYRCQGFLSHACEHGVTIQTIEGITEVQLYQTVSDRHGLRESSCSVDYCFTSSGGADSELNWL